MIYDKLENAKNYKGISKWLDIAIGFIETHDLSKLPNGKTVIDGDNVFANVMDAEASPASEKEFEIHKKYMDIQIDLEGTEEIQIGIPVEEATVCEETDFGTVKCHTKTSCQMGEGFFIVCMAMEPHKPGIAACDELHLRKCVLKVLAK